MPHIYSTDAGMQRGIVGRHWEVISLIRGNNGHWRSTCRVATHIAGGQLWGVALLLCLGGLLGFSGVVFGAQTRNLVGSFGELNAPEGVAVNSSSGDVFVAESGKNRIQVFDALGDPLFMFGAGVGGPGVDTCVSLCQSGIQGSGPGEFTTARFVAVDSSSGMSAGDVYVGDTGDSLISKFDSAGNLIVSWGAGGQLNGSSTGAGSFGTLAGIAVDSTGNLLVLNTSQKVFKFEQDGKFTGEFPVMRGVLPRGLGVDASGHLFKVNPDGSLEELTPTGADIGTVTPDTSFSAPKVATFVVGPESGELDVANLSGAIDHYMFNGAGEVLEPNGGTCVLEPEVGCEPSVSVPSSVVASGIGAAPGGGLYLSDSVDGDMVQYSPLLTIPDVVTGEASEIHPATAALNGVVNPHGLEVTKCEFEYVDAEDYEPLAVNPYSAGGTVGCEGAVGSGVANVPVHATVSGLTAGVSYHFRLLAANSNGMNPGGDATFSTPPAPAVSGEMVEGLTRSSAILVADVNPENSETSYRFEYGTSTSYGTSVPVPDGHITAGSATATVSQSISGLAADATYHWRVVAGNANGVSTGFDHTFRYDTAGGELPDDRAYEMVTPPQKNGTLIGDVSFIAISPVFSGNGSRLIASSIQCFADAVSCNAQKANGVGSPYEFTRTGGGWVVTPMAPAANVLSSNVTWGYSADAGMALFSAPTPPFGEDDFYLRRADGTFVDVGPLSPPEEGALGPIGGRVADITQALSTDFTHFVWEAVAHWPFDTAEGASLYEYVGIGNTQPLMVSVSGSQGSTDAISKCGSRLGGAENLNVPGALSDDGRVVFFTAFHCLAGGTGVNAGIKVPVDEVFARVDGETAAAHTLTVSSASECGAGGSVGEVSCRKAQGEPGDALFLAASADGSKAFFTSTQQLTDDASEDNHHGDTASELQRGCARTTGVNGCNLYEYDLSAPASRHLTTISAGDTSGGGPRVQGVMAVSPDGSHVYFVAKGVLTSEANREGISARAGANNLYVFERNAAYPTGRLVFITSMPSVDEEVWARGVGLPANVTSDGRFLVFLSHGRLTADDTSVGGAFQVFRYDAQTGALVRVSRGENGFNNDGNSSSPTPCSGVGCSEDARIPLEFGASRSGPSMSEDGRRVFFQSPVGLTPRALDDVQIGADSSGNPVYAQNVYEWEEGHVYLISDGRDVTVDAGQEPQCGLVGVPSSVCLLGSDASGTNVFFSTAEGLVGQDTDGEVDYYDARVCTADSPCLDQSARATVECRDESCHGNPSAVPGVPVMASVEFVGPGNTKPSPTTSGRVKAKVLHGEVRGSRLVVMVRVFGKGRIAVTGGQVKVTRRMVARGGSYRMAVSLKRSAAGVLRQRHRLGVRLRVWFTPANGRAAFADISMLVKG